MRDQFSTWRLGGPFRRAHGAGSSLPPIDLTAAAASLQFVEGNWGPNATPTGKGALYQPDTGFVIPAAATPHATFAIVRLPLGKRKIADSGGIWGTGGTGGTRFWLQYGHDANGTTAARNKFRAYESGSSGTNADISSVAWTEDAALVVVYSDGTNFAVDWYSLIDGTRFAGPTAAFTKGITSPIGTEFGIGRAANGTSFATDTNSTYVAWQGEIAALGMVNINPTVTQWQDIALGADIITTLGASALIYLRQFDGTAASYAKPAGATSDTTAAAQAYTSTTGNGVTIKTGSTLRRQSASQWLRMAPLEPRMVYGLTVGQSSRSVPFSGTAGGATGDVEVRVYNAQTGAVVVDWTSVGAISGGVWSGSLTIPKSNGWLYADARLASAPSVIFYRRDLFGVGWKIMLLGQSQMSIAQGGTLGTGTVPNTYAQEASYVDNLTDYYVATTGIGVITNASGLRAFVNQFRAFEPTAPLMVINEAINGTSMLQMIDATSAIGTVNTRNWSQMTDKLDRVGYDISVVVHNWGTADANAGYADYQNRMEALLYGTGPLALDYNLTATLTAGWVFALSPLTRAVQDATQAGQTKTARSAGVDFANSNNLTVGPPVLDSHIEAIGGPHQTMTLLMGHALSARSAVAAAKALGLTSLQNPYFSGAVANGGRTVITVSVTMPNGGTLYSPLPNALASFEIDDGGTGTWVNTGFTAVISGNDVVITKTSGAWLAGTKVRYLANLKQRANGDSAAEIPIIDSALYETWAGDVLGRGMPLSGSLSSGKWIPEWEATV